MIHDLQEADILFSIIDGDGETLYREVQHVAIVNGAISVLVGRGRDPDTNAVTGGIPMEGLLPDGTKFLRIKLMDQSIPQEDLQIVSVPYALYAESLTHQIESSEILDGGITQADLSEELLAFLDASISGVSEADLLAHRTEGGAHPATSISVTNTFVNASGDNLQEVLQGLDTAISFRMNQDTEIGEDIDAETAAREMADTTERSVRETADTTLQSNIDAERSERISADSTLQGNIGAERSAREAADTTERLAREAEDSAIRGDLTSHTSATSAHGSDGNVIGQNTLNSTISTHSTTDIETAHPNGQISGDRIQDGTITSGDIQDGTITSGDIQNGTITSNDIADGTITTADLDTSGAQSFAGWDTAASDDLTTSTAFSGDVSGTYNNLQFSSRNVSQFTNNSGYITDGNTGWDNSYGFITAADIPSYDFTGWDTDASDDSGIADSRITNAINNDTIPNTAAEIGAAPASHGHDYAPREASIIPDVNCAWEELPGNGRESNGTWYVCPGNKVMVGRRHSGDENGHTWYYCCNLRLSF